MRIGLFLGVTVYAWGMLVLLEWLRERQEFKRSRALQMETTT